MRPLRHITGLTLLCAVALGGCTWGDLNKQQRKTHVVVYEKPNAFTASAFGQHTIALRQDSTYTGRTLVVGGQSTDVVAVIDFKDSGGAIFRYATVDSGQLKIEGSRDGNMVQALTQLDPAGGNARVLAGVPTKNYVRVVTIPTAPANEKGQPLQPASRINADDLNLGPVFPGFGKALAAASLDGADVFEWAIAYDHGVVVLHNGSIAVGHATPLHDPTLDADSEVSMAPISVAGLNKIAIGRRLNTGRGQVSFLGWTGVNPVDESPIDGVERHFGHSLAVGDLNNDGFDDLVVGAPQLGDGALGSKVYVFMGDTTSLTRTYILESQDTGFGASVAIVNVDGVGKPELVVGNTTAAFPGGNTGQVHIYSYDWLAGVPLGPPEPANLTEAIIGDTAKPNTMVGADLKEKSSLFGSSLASLIWTPSTTPADDRRELFIGGGKQVYGFYLTGLPGDDDSDVTGHDPRF